MYFHTSYSLKYYTTLPRKQFVFATAIKMYPIRRQNVFQRQNPTQFTRMKIADDKFKSTKMKIPFNSLLILGRSNETTSSDVNVRSSSNISTCCPFKNRLICTKNTDFQTVKPEIHYNVNK